jgi:hypothetical protein
MASSLLGFRKGGEERTFDSPVWILERTKSYYYSQSRVLERKKGAAVPGYKYSLGQGESHEYECGCF